MVRLQQDRHQQLLRAGITVSGQSITLYEELYPSERLGSREVKHLFFSTLQRMLLSQRQDIILADSALRVPFLNYVESFGWIGRRVFEVATGGQRVKLYIVTA